MLDKIKKNNTGTTLIELLVAVTLFSVIMLSATAIFKIMVEGQRNAIAAQNAQESMKYVFEVMAKEVRMAQKSNDECRIEIGFSIPATYKVYNVSSNGEGDILYFKNKNTDCVAYYLADGYLMVYRGGEIASTTPSGIKVSNLKFKIIDDLIDAFHSVQPQVTMVMDIEAVGKIMHKQKMKMQTTISSRYYE
ncbi:MAG: prepilin-type N-terminal cleavage/methylation domain-containing protein [Patescibacteria group bacterium]|nr:prepilin-type N-terminal cleavage/methylation domain-containing protein [Patescibacteria group bacterium]